MEPSLPDELLLLALHDEQGQILRAAAPALREALVGAAMMELSLQGRLSEGTGRQLAVDPTPTGDEILDDISRRIAEAERREDAATWVGRLTQVLPDLKARLLTRMVAAGVLQRRERRVLWVYPTSTFPQSDDAPERQARERIRAAVLDGEQPDARTLALISLVQACNLLDELFAPQERPAARRRIDELLPRLVAPADNKSSSPDRWPASTWEERRAPAVWEDAAARAGGSTVDRSYSVRTSSIWADAGGS